MTISSRLRSISVPLLLTIGLTIFTQSFFLSRKSFTTRSSCDGAPQLLFGLGLTQEELEFLQEQKWLNGHDNDRGGCWTPRRIDSLIILVVDALRFDFARDHLPLSVGSRLFAKNDVASKDNNNTHGGYSRLYQFVADPPTVTMQRLKALTTGGLPTFADITGSFGGANVEEDSWVEQLVATRSRRRSALASQHRNSGDEEDVPKLAFVGDDTWVDLFPTQFDDSHPYPSFNTRDLDTVDDGCLMHLPRLLNGLIGLKKNETNESLLSLATNESLAQQQPKHQTNTSSSAFELIVAHFLGVDHVGHTYGPNDPHMERKLHQMDLMLSHTLDVIDDAPPESCVAAFVFGDHGMTEDGNHGGGTSEERNAGLFAHYSAGCRRGEKESEEAMKLDGGEIGKDAVRAFESINQIDLVPTISMLLGLPIPYANIGGLVPELLPGGQISSSSSSTPHAAVALALNAAQVWTYFNDYSKRSRDLPLDRLKELKDLLDSATAVYKDALVQAKNHARKKNRSERIATSEGKEENTADYYDSIAFRHVCSLYKLFLAESTDLGKRVWTQFNEVGMMIGIGLLALACVMALPLWRKGVRAEIGRVLWNEYKGGGSKGHEKEFANGTSKTCALAMRSFRIAELAAAFIFMIFHCGILTFGNSYIENERDVVTFFLSSLCVLIFRRLYNVSNLGHLPLRDRTAYFPLVVAVCARANDVFVTGHGLDPSIRLHAAHHSLVFLSSLAALAFLRLAWLDGQWFTASTRNTSNSLSVGVDVIAITCLAMSWWEKRSRDHSRNGFYMARLAIMLTLMGLLHSAYNIVLVRSKMEQASSINGRGREKMNTVHLSQLALYRVMMFIVIVTGPSTALTGVLVMIQTAALCFMMESSGAKEVDAPVMAALWRLVIRHIFFATNHHCSFNRLHYSAAFVATNTFLFHIAGASLFMNTFGWEIIGSILVMVLSRCTDSGIRADGKIQFIRSRDNVWHWFLFYQWTEILSSCVSVSAMKRHLMVWAIFAPRFMFGAVFTALNLILCILSALFDWTGSN
eukprot:CCRYP_016515-RA/>CCRYP_016515-RA protein AED:0.20 eAED:0.20 QI:286/1/1/1/0.5/0.33/3/202/1032